MGTAMMTALAVAMANPSFLMAIPLCFFFSANNNKLNAIMFQTFVRSRSVGCSASAANQSSRVIDASDAVGALDDRGAGDDYTRVTTTRE